MKLKPGDSGISECYSCKRAGVYEILKEDVKVRPHTLSWDQKKEQFICGMCLVCLPTLGIDPPFYHKSKCIVCSNQLSLGDWINICHSCHQMAEQVGDNTTEVMVNKCILTVLLLLRSRAPKSVKAKLDAALRTLAEVIIVNEEGNEEFPF